ncbi:MAG: DUF1674 domain-containing protein [Pseudomonadota bacterium]
MTQTPPTEREPSPAAGETSPAATTTSTGSAQEQEGSTAEPREIGGRDGPEPTRFGDWEKNGRCIDF